MVGAKAMDPNIGANLPEEERRRLHEMFGAAVSGVRREEAARRDEERLHNQGDQPRGRAVHSPEHPAHDPVQAQQRQWATIPLSGGNMDYLDALRLSIAEMPRK